jgi:hypothetical protein
MVGRSVRVAGASSDNQKFHLKRSRLRYLPLTPLQATRVNSAVANHEAPERWLSPRQRELYARVQGASEESLEGLEVPTDERALSRYEGELRARLAAR